MTPTLITLDGNLLDIGDRFVLSRWSGQSVPLTGNVSLVLNDVQRDALRNVLGMLNKKV